MRFARVLLPSAHSKSGISRLVETAALDVLQLDFSWSGVFSQGPAYAPGLLDQLRALHRTMYLDPNLHLITDGGRGNPVGCAEKVAEFLCEHGDGNLPLSVIRGDNLLPHLETLMAEGVSLVDPATGLSVHEIKQPLLAAHVELGAGPITTALTEGARIVIAGCYDVASPLIATAVAALEWRWDQLNELAQLTVAAQLANTLLEIDEAGGLAVHAQPGCALETERLKSSITAAASARHADVICSATNFELQEISTGGLAIDGVQGRATDEKWNLRLTYQDGFVAEGLFSCNDLVAGRKALDQFHEILNGEVDQQRSIATELLQSASTEDSALVRICCRSNQSEPCVAFAEQLSAIADQKLIPDCELTGTEPSWHGAFKQVCCPIPREAVAVSVDTRLAKEWR